MDAAYLKLLEKDYGIVPSGFFRQRGNFIVQTPTGAKELKKNTADPKRILFENDARNRLASSGFPAETFIPTLEGAPFCRLDENRYVLTNHFPSLSADLSDNAVLLKCAELLGDFHNAAKGLFSEYEVTNAGNLISFYEKRIREMKKIRSKISVFNSPSKVDIIIKENYGYYLDRASQALDILKSSQYDSLWEKAFTEKLFIHGSFKKDSIRINESGNKVLVTSFSKCAIDVQTSDLSEYIRRYIKNPDSEFCTVEKIISAYGKKHPISDSDIKILTGMLTYPQKFMKLLNEHYNKRRVYISDAVCARFMKCINRKEHENKILSRMEKMT